MRTRTRSLLVDTPFLALCVLLTVHASAQPAPGQGEGAPQAPEPTTEEPGETGETEETAGKESDDAAWQKRAEALRAVLATLSTKKAEREQLQTELDAAKDLQQRADLNQAIKAVEAQITELDEQFGFLASDVHLSEVRDAEGPSDLRSEIEGLVKPYIQMFKEATEEPRLRSQLQAQLGVLEERIQKSGRAIVELEKAIERNQDAELGAELQRKLDQWQGLKTEFVDRRQAVSFEHQQRDQAKRSVVDMVDSFFRQKGLNIVLAIAAFALMFFLCRMLHRHVVTPIYLRGKRSFLSRLVNVLFLTFSFAASVGAMLVTLFTIGDWALLLLVLIFLFGVGWRSIQMLPIFFEQARLLLNLGSVREDERIIFNDLPWRVEALRLYTRLRNPELTGGLLRVPIRDLIGQLSRPMADNEEWFPSREGDWVLFGDEERGKVVLQTPEYVRLSVPGGAQVTIPTADYLGLHPRNLSQGFRAEVVFGIDYALQSDATRAVPQRMQARVEKGLLDVLEPAQIQRIQVELREAGASSIDYEVEVDVDGSAAPQYETIKRALTRILVDACNEEGWTIPFSQLTIHQAA